MFAQCLLTEKEIYPKVILFIHVFVIVSCFFFLQLSEFHFHRGVKAVAVEDYKKCLSNMHDCFYPLAEALKYGSSAEHIKKEHSVLETDVRINTALAESMQSRQTGRKFRNIPNISSYLLFLHLFSAMF